MGESYASLDVWGLHLNLLNYCKFLQPFVNAVNTYRKLTCKNNAASVNPETSELFHSQVLLTIQEQMYEWCNENWRFNQLSTKQAIKCQILHTVWYIFGERLKEKIMADHSWEWKG